MLTQKETAALLEILAHEDKSLETAAAAFQRAFVRADHFRVAAAMCIMIDDNLMPRMHRCVALFIIYELYKNEPPGIHPFMPFLVGMLQAQQADGKSPHERNLLCVLLATTSGGPKDVPKKTPTELAAMWKPGGELLPMPPLVRCRPRPPPPLVPGPPTTPALPPRNAPWGCARGRERAHPGRVANPLTSAFHPSRF